jgi:hypothetical protein
VPARLFCYIKKTFARFNKTIVLAVIVLFAVTFLSVTHVFALDSTSFKTDYAEWLNLFSTSSGFTSSGVESSTSNNSAIGLTFAINLAIQPPTGKSTGDAWDDIGGEDEGFAVEVCTANNANCWVSSGDNLFNAGGVNVNDHIIFNKDSNDAYIKTEQITATLFDAKDIASVNGGVFNYNPSTGAMSQITSINDISSVAFAPGTTLNATLWYCASGKGADAADVYKGITTPGITTFNQLCGGSTYFSIGSPTQIVISSTPGGLQQQVQAGQQLLSQSPTSTSEVSLPLCVLEHPITQHGTVNGCVADVSYGVYYLCAWVAGLFGELFDFFIGYSLSSSSYTYPFVVTGWDLVRDISNIFFIIIMVWTGFSAVFDTNTTSMKKVVPNLIINALLINFSLFATRVVIDISNITARVFYNQMVVCSQTTLAASGTGACPSSGDLTGVGGYPSLSVKIVSAFDPEQMFKPSVLVPPTNSTDSTQNVASSAANAANTSAQANNQDRTVANYFTIVSLIAAAIMIFIAIMFFKVSFLFIGRVVGLYICMIFSPFAFMSRDIPMLSGIERLRWADWSKELTSYAMLAPVFVFFLYIIYTFLSSNFVQQIGVQAVAASGFFATVMSIVIPMLIIYFLLQAAQKTAEKLAGEIGRTIQKFGEQATGFVAGAAVGIATGGASLAGTSAAGLFKLSDEKRANLETQKAAGGLSGRMASMQLKSSDWTQKQTFDARNTKGLKFLTKQFGADANNGLVNTLGFGSDRTKGGRESMIKRQADETKKKIESVKVSVKDPKAFWQEKIEGDAEKKYLTNEKKKISDLKKNAKTEEEKADAKKQEEDFKKSKKDKTYKNTDAYKDTVKTEQDTADSTYGKVTNNKQLTQAVRMKYATTLEKRADNVNPKDMVSIPTLLGGMTEATGKKKGARAYLEEQKKSLREKPLEDRLAEQNKKIEDKTKKVEDKIKQVEDKRKDIYAAEVARIKADPALRDLPENKDISVDHFTDEKNADRAKEVIEKHREELKNKADSAELDIKRADADYTKAISEDNPIMAAGYKMHRDAAIANKNKHKADYEFLNPENKEKLEDDLSNLEDKRNNNDEKIGRITDKQKDSENKSKGDKDKPKEDNK